MSDNNSSKLSTFTATHQNVEQILDITNEAFVADTFFKKPEYHLRFDKDTVLTMIDSTNAFFILASMKSGSQIDEVCGSLYFNWTSSQTIEEEEDRKLNVVGHFSAVSVPDRYSRKGIGKLLVKTAENKLMEVAKQQLELANKINTDEVNNSPTSESESLASSHRPLTLSVTMEMGVINLRKDLFPWYESQGYAVVGEIRPNDAEITRIILEDLDVCCVLMRKVIV